jgi:hypothetical protein
MLDPIRGREIEAGELEILNVGVAAEDRELPFWVRLTDSRLSSLYRRDESLDDRHPVEEIPPRSPTGEAENPDQQLSSAPAAH